MKMEIVMRYLTETMIRKVNSYSTQQWLIELLITYKVRLH